MPIKRKPKNVTYRVWVDSARGDDYAYSVRGAKNTARLAKRLHKKGRLNSVTVATGRSLLSERKLNKTEKAKLNAALKRLKSRRRRSK